VPHAWKNTSAETGRVLFLYTPAKAGGFFEERLGRPEGSINGAEANEMRRRHGWEIVGPPSFLSRLLPLARAYKGIGRFSQLSVPLAVSASPLPAVVRIASVAEAMARAMAPA
jgi:hypothetical protein